MAQPLELAGAYARTEEGNIAQMYGGGGVAYASTSAACAFVPLAVRKGTTVGVWENGKVVEYIWHTDTSNTGLLKKTADVDFSTLAKLAGGNSLTGDQSTSAGKVNNTSRTASANLTQNQPGNTLFTDGNFNAHVSNSDYLNYGSRPTFGFTIDGVYGAAIYLRSNIEKPPLWFEVQDINGKTDRLALASEIPQSKFVGKFTTLASLQAVVGFEGAYAYFDAGAGTNALEYIWDSTDNIWVPSSNTGASSFGQLSGAPADNAALATALGSKLTGTAATDAETQIAATVTEDSKFVSRLKLFNWWTWIKGQAATISGAWNFTGTLKVNGADVLTAGSSGDVSTKLNIGANTGLAGIGAGPAIVSANGTIGRDVNLAWDAAGKNLQVGSSGNVASFTVVSNEFKLKVQDNITSGNASIEFNDNQTKALVFRSTDTKEYMAFRSTDNDEAVILLQKYVFDMGIFSPLNNAQTQVSTSATTKLYALDSLGNPFSIPFAVDGSTIFIYGRFKAVNNSGTIGNSVIAGSFEIVLRRVAGVISVVGKKTTLLADTLSSNCVVEADSLDNNSIQIYVQPNNATALDWKLSDIKYFI